MRHTCVKVSKRLRMMLAQLRILSSMMEKETHVDSTSSGEQADICQILFDIVEDQSDVHRRAVKETAISGPSTK